MNGMEKAEAPCRDHGVTTAAATVAEEIDLLADVGTELNQFLIIGGLEQIQALLRTDKPCMAVFDQGLCGRIKGHADLLRCIAVPAEVVHFVAAVTDADGPEGSHLDDLGRPFIIEDMQTEFRGKGRLVDEYTAQLCLSGREEGFYEVLFHVEVLKEEFAERLLVEIRPDPHERKLEKSRHGRGKDIGFLPFFLDVEEKRPVCQVIQYLLSRRPLHLPDAGGTFCREWFYGEERYQSGILFGEQDTQDSIQRVRWGRPLGKEIDPIDKGRIA